MGQPSPVGVRIGCTEEGSNSMIFNGEVEFPKHT
jgi:hypothetical protein